MCTCLWSPETIDSAVPCRCSYISRHMLTQYCNICIDGFAALSQNFTIQLFTSYFTRDLFEWIELEPFQFWRSLLFMDQYNYGGIPAKSDESQVDIISSWNIAEYLPKKIQTSCDQFIVIVSQFLYIPWSYAQKQAGIRESMLNGDSCTPSINIGAAKALESEMIEYIKEQISSFFTDNLLRILRYIVLHMKRASKSEDDPSTSSGLPQIVGDQHRGDAS
ncbi:hypothetical protein Ahy_A06g028876 isoform E [Arachis hypogaea]|uniref:DNA polymerase epsilon catalytic subunit n=1 Tax=Arachis hypogaea TaxID=3818 RepID=A0A445CRT2_ARAHY|nr:hypothetical protein Ahy_A06g028876 isoform E [Arachis hypogaea]